MTLLYRGGWRDVSFWPYTMHH